MTTGSSNYHLLKDRLGTGSSCDVFKGVHKVSLSSHRECEHQFKMLKALRNFNVVAVKVLKDHSWRKEIEKEVAALVQLESHPNIVKFYGKDHETTKKLPCLVVEYCDLGSLHSVLKEVENKHGLSDSEFLSLLKDITNGLEHLHRHGCIHRDIKPGNILKSSSSDGKSTYKLSDFGASRMYSGSDEVFYSLAGTEEYLHPDMYEKAFINRRCDARFDHRADMWSLGCTLYQAITGEMPYKPFDGARNNRTIMFQMVARKPKGAIAGYQYSSDGEIVWLKNLPTDCNMTCDLRSHVVSILVGLMEAGRAQWTFDKYKQAVTEVLDLKLVIVLDCEEISMHHLYMEPSKSLAEFKDRVSYYTDIHSDQQKMYYNQMSLSYFLQEQRTVATFPATHINQPIFVMSTQPTEKPFFSRQFSLEPYESFRSRSSIVDDIQVAGNQCQAIHQLYLKMVDSKAIILGLYTMTLTLWKNKMDRYSYIRNKNRHLYRWYHNSYLTAQNHLQNGERSVIENLSQQANTLRQKIDPLISTEIMASSPEVLDDDWCTTVKSELVKGKNLMNRMNHRKREVLTDCELAEHQADKAEMQEIIARCVYLWQTCCVVQVKQAIHEFSKSKSIYKHKAMAMVKLDTELNSFEKRAVQAMNATIFSKEAVTQQTKPTEYRIKKMSNSKETQVRRLIDEVKSTSLSMFEELSKLPEVMRLNIDEYEENEDTLDESSDTSPDVPSQSTMMEKRKSLNVIRSESDFETQPPKDEPDIGSTRLSLTSRLSDPKNKTVKKAQVGEESGIFTGVSKSS